LGAWLIRSTSSVRNGTLRYGSLKKTETPLLPTCNIGIQPHVAVVHTPDIQSFIVHQKHPQPYRPRLSVASVGTYIISHISPLSHTHTLSLSRARTHSRARKYAHQLKRQGSCNRCNSPHESRTRYEATMPRRAACAETPRYESSICSCSLASFLISLGDRSTYSDRKVRSTW
jgi:hypothetical protein